MQKQASANLTLNEETKQPQHENTQKNRHANGNAQENHNRQCTKDRLSNETSGEKQYEQKMKNESKIQSTNQSQRQNERDKQQSRNNINKQNTKDKQIVKSTIFQENLANKTNQQTDSKKQQSTVSQTQNFHQKNKNNQQSSQVNKKVQHQQSTNNKIKQPQLKTNKKPQTQAKTDENYNHVFHKGQIISNIKKNKFYRAIQFIGKGTFGQVISVHQINKNGQFQHTMAMKIIKKQTAYINQGLIQIKNLRQIAKYQQLTQGNRKNYLNLYDAFMWQGYLCIAMQLLDNSILNILQTSNYKGLQMKWIQKWIKQLLLQLSKIHTIGIYHCDIKPQNIMFRPNQPQKPLFIDFSSSCSKNTQLFTYIQSRFYRSPQVLIGLKPYTQKIDIWSLGCILAEMYLGLPLFPGASSYDQIDKICKLLGNRIYDDSLEEMIKKSEFGLNFFVIQEDLSNNVKKQIQDVQIDKKGFSRKRIHLEHVENQMTSKNVIIRLKNPKQYMKATLSRFETNQDYFCLENIEDMINIRNPSPKDIQTHELFIDLLKKMLTFNPQQRISAQEAFTHPFVGGIFSELEQLRNLQDIIDQQNRKKNQIDKNQVKE